MSKLIASFIFLSFLATGCAVQDFGSPNVYRRSDVQRTGSIQDATVIHVRVITIQAHPTTVPTVLGALGGAFLGSRIGRGNGRTFAAVAGGLGAALVARHVTDAEARHTGLEIAVRLANGTRAVVVQPDDQPFSPGDHVFLVTSWSGARITH